MTHDPLDSTRWLLAMQITESPDLPGLHGLAASLDGIRALAVTAAEVHAAMERFGSAIAVHIPYDLPTFQFKTDFSGLPKITCDCCCHFQAHPPSAPSPLNNSHVRNTHLNTTPENECRNFTKRFVCVSSANYSVVPAI